MGIGLCCCSDTGENKLFKYIGKSYLSSAYLLNKYPGKDINPAFVNKQSDLFYNNNTRNFISGSQRDFRYGYQIEVSGDKILVAAGDRGLIMYERKGDLLKKTSRLTLVSGRGSKASATIDLGFGIQVECFFGDSLGSRYGYESIPFSGVYGVSKGNLGGDEGFFVSCGVSGVRFVDEEGSTTRIIEQDREKIIRRSCDTENYLIVGLSKYIKPQMNFSDSFDQLDFLPEGGNTVVQGSKPNLPENITSSGCEIYSKNEGSKKVTFTDKKINTGSVNDIQSIADTVYIAHEDGLTRAKIELKKNPLTEVEELVVEQVNLISGKSVYSVELTGSSWIATTKDGYFYDGSFNSISMSKTFIQDSTPLADGQKRTRINTKDSVKQGTYIETTDKTFDIRGDSITKGYSGEDNDLIIGAFPVATNFRRKSFFVACWQGGININNNQIFDITWRPDNTTYNSGWKSSTSSLIRDGYGTFQYTFSAISIVNSGKYTYVLDSLQFIANSMGPGWFSPEHSQAEKKMGAPIELFFDGLGGYEEAPSGILILKQEKKEES
tara:strand:- start:1977 stop:3629 length:1653 start_codon:yes stop_codon:yes gene_type:complete